MEKIKIIVDCDPGYDDAVALAYALKHPKFEVLGIHSVSGNVSVDKTTKNIQGISKILNTDVPIYRGSDSPLFVENYHVENIHGENGLHGYIFEDINMNKLSELSSIEGYVKELRNNKVTIVCLGPLTNIAKLIVAYPELKTNIDSICLMGGGLKGGNVTVCGEFNFYADPHAADIVFKSGVKIIMAGLDVTERATFEKEDFDKLYKQGTVGKFLTDVSIPTFEFMERNGHKKGVPMHDVVPLVYLTNEEIFKTKDLAVLISIESGLTRGLSIADTRARSTALPNARVIMDMDVNAFRELAIETLK